MSTNEEKSIQTTEDQALTSLNMQQQRFVHLYMTGQHSLVKIAQLMNLHPNTLGNWLKRKDVKDAIADIQGGVHDQVTIELKNLTLKATQKLNALMDSPIDGVALQAVKDVLDRAGHKTKQEIKIDKTVTTIEQQMKKLIDSTIIDADFEEME